MINTVFLAGLLVLTVEAGAATTACLFSFTEFPVCRSNDYAVRIRSERVDEKERRLESLRVTIGDRTQILEISPDTTMIEGDRGRVVFEDINFDDIPDLGVTTSFGVANLFLDYWVYEPGRQRFRFVGNYARLTPDRAERTLHSQIRINAVEYERRTYRWNEGRLIKVPQ